MELLDAYARRHSEEAFRELVARHVDFVYSAALRQLRNPHLAQEAVQSAFIALAKKAGRLRHQTILAGWLHHAAHFAALNLQRSEARRKHWEQEAAVMNASIEEERTFPEHVLPQVDAALDELSESDRDAIILRFLQQKNLLEVAEALGTSEEAAKKRVSRALDKLRGLLVGRGVAVSVAALGAGLSQIPVTAAPAALSSSVSALAVTTAGAGTTALVSAAKVKLALAAGLILLGGLAVLFWPRSPANNVKSVTVTTATSNTLPAASMKIKFTSVMVDDQDKALKFYTEMVGFLKKRDFRVGASRWLTVVSPAEADGTELLLEPMSFAPARAFQAALYKSGIPFTAFMAEDVQHEYNRMTKLGVKFSSPPGKAGPTTVAHFEDTCGNRIQLFQPPGVGETATPAIQLKLTSLMVEEQDQEKALRFYTEMFGFVKKTDMPAGGGRWLTVVSSDEPEGTELSLEPMGLAFMRTYQKALYGAGIPWTSLLVADVNKEYERLTRLGVVFRTQPTNAGSTTMAVLDDTCGNLIRIVQL